MVGFLRFYTRYAVRTPQILARGRKLTFQLAIDFLVFVRTPQILERGRKLRWNWYSRCFCCFVRPPLILERVRKRKAGCYIIAIATSLAPLNLARGRKLTIKDPAEASFFVSLPIILARGRKRNFLVIFCFNCTVRTPKILARGRKHTPILLPKDLSLLEPP